MSPLQVEVNDYVAVFIPGGYGQFFDVVCNDTLCKLIADIYKNGAVVGSAGHGAASLTNIELSDKKYLVSGVKMTCFPHQTEVEAMFVSDYGKLLPFNMEVRLKQRGANLVMCADYKKATDNCETVVDSHNRIVTGAFAHNAMWVAEEIDRQVRFLRMSEIGK